MKLLEKINYGYSELEPIILGLMGMNRSFLLIGKHGTGKTRLARLLSKGYSSDGFVFYDATKDDLISIAGIPDPESIKKGNLRFVPHERSIWNKTTILVDEITRAGKESQNLWLEILEQRTCFGIPLIYQSFIATANPESYAAAFQMDEALLDRFVAVIPVPEFQESVSSDDVAAMIALAMSDDTNVESSQIEEYFRKIKQAYAELEAGGAVQRIAAYLGRLIPSLLSMESQTDPVYISPRTFARNLPIAILSAAAYFKVEGYPDALTRGAVEGLRYGLATKLQIKPILLDQLHEAAATLLEDGALKPHDRLKLSIAALKEYDERFTFLKENWEEMKKLLTNDELHKYVGALLDDACEPPYQSRLLALGELLKTIKYKGEALRRIEGKLTILLRNTLKDIVPQLTIAMAAAKKGKKGAEKAQQIQILIDRINSGELMKDTSAAALLLKANFIDVSGSGAEFKKNDLQRLIAEYLA